MGVRAQILLVEDEPAIAELLTRVFAMGGYTTCWAPHGQRALELLAAAPPGLMTLDLNMPHLSGVEVLSQIRATPRLHDLPVVVLTSREEVPVVVQAQATLVMQKPFDIPELLAAAAAFLEAPFQARAVGT